MRWALLLSKSLKILLVEDDQGQEELLRLMLDSLGLTDVTTAANGDNAYSLIEETADPFDLIISDMHMPGLSGIQLLEKIRDDKRHYATPFILITADNAVDLPMHAIDHEVSSFLQKPFLPDRFKEHILNALAKGEQ
ncbi:response regulator [Magnetovibrio sp. PR-2]|uniref:response regulator n=1 Tax=Magnetovibrio sp. PR-2 TaxID=3120356 RepID=UPI002FCDE55D